MRSTITRQPLSTTLVWFSLLVVLFVVRHIMAPLPIEEAVANTMPLGALIDMAANHNEWIHSAISLVFIYFTAISITRLISRNLVFPARTHTFLPLLAITALGICIPTGNGAVSVAAYLLARGSEYFASAFRRTARPGDLFGGGLLFGLTSLLYAPAAIYLVLALVAMPIYMRSLRETMLTMVAALLPIFACCYVYWAMDRPFLEPCMSIRDALTAHIAIPDLPLTRIVAAGMVALCVIMSLAAFVADGHKIRTRAYRIHIYMLCYLVVAVAGWRSVNDIMLVAVPMSVVASLWFARREGWVPTVVYLLTVAAAVVANLYVL